MNRRKFLNSLAVVPVGAAAVKLSIPEAAAIKPPVVDQCDFVMLRTPTPTVMLRNVRLAFPRIFQPMAPMPYVKPRYSASFMLHDVDTAELEKVMAEVALNKWHGARGKIHTCIRDGRLYASTLVRPMVIDKDAFDLIEADGKIYPGCIVNTQIALHAVDAGSQKRVCAQLRGVQFVRDGEKLS